MKTQEQLQRAVDEIREVCKKHGIALIGTCKSESIYGEITILDADNPMSWGWSEPPCSNVVEKGEVYGIGDLPPTPELPGRIANHFLACGHAWDSGAPRTSCGYCRAPNQVFFKQDPERPYSYETYAVAPGYSILERHMTDEGEWQARARSYKDGQFYEVTVKATFDEINEHPLGAAKAVLEVRQKAIDGLRRAEAAGGAQSGG